MRRTLSEVDLNATQESDEARDELQPGRPPRNILELSPSTDASLAMHDEVQPAADRRRAARDQLADSAAAAAVAEAGGVADVTQVDVEDEAEPASGMVTARSSYVNLDHHRPPPPQPPH